MVTVAGRLPAPSSTGTGTGTGLPTPSSSGRAYRERRHAGHRDRLRDR